MWLDPFSLGLDAPLATARGSITERRGFLVGVDDPAAIDVTGDGSASGLDELAVDHDRTATGIGEATPLPGWTEPYAACERALSAAADGGAIDPESTPAAAHGVELAALDAAGRRAGRPLATLLARAAFDEEAVSATVPVNATVGDGSVAETVAAAERAVAAGFDCLKCKVGARDLATDRRRLRAVREAVGTDVALRVDANGAWDRPTATRAVTAFADLGVTSVEQPLPADDVAGHRHLRGNGVDIAVDESLARYGIEAIRDRAAADVVVCKPMALGGPLRTARVAATARAAGIEPVVTTTVDAVVARTAAVHVAAAIPDVAACGLATASLLRTDLAADPVTVADGTATVPTGGGLCGDAFASLRARR